MHMLTTQMPNTSSTQSKHPLPKWYFSPFLYLVFSFTFPSHEWFIFPSHEKICGKPCHRPMCRHHQSRGPQRAPQKGLVEHDFLVDRVGWGDLGSCWLDNASGSTTNKAIIVSNWKGFSSQGFGSTLYLFWGQIMATFLAKLIWIFISSKHFVKGEMSERCFVQQKITAKKTSDIKQKRCPGWKQVFPPTNRFDFWRNILIDLKFGTGFPEWNFPKRISPAKTSGSSPPKTSFCTGTSCLTSQYLIWWLNWW